MSKKFADILTSFQKISAIRFLILDIDGVMTDGSIVYTSSGEELKSFDVKDGAGINCWLQAGHGIGIISGRASPIILRRSGELGIERVSMAAKDKLPAAEKMLADAGVTFSETVAIGDDLPDIPLISRAALGVAVGDAAADVKDAARCITNNSGGRGAVRETIEAILKAQGLWQCVIARYYQ